MAVEQFDQLAQDEKIVIILSLIVVALICIFVLILLILYIRWIKKKANLLGKRMGSFINQKIEEMKDSKNNEQ